MNLAGVQVDPRLLLEKAVRNVRPVKTPTMRWMLVRDTFGIAGLQAYAMCRELKINPEERVMP